MRYEVNSPTGLILVEERDIVYRAAPSPGEPQPTPKPAPAQADFSRRVEPNPIMLFRYSALTFNAHRIHYDRVFCAEEVYPGLVVHGPLIATLLLGLVRDTLPQAQITHFSYRAVSPLFDTHDFTINGRQDGNEIRLWAANHRGQLAMQAEVVLA